MHRGEVGRKLNVSKVGGATGVGGDRGGLVGDNRAVHIDDADAGFQAVQRIGCLVDDHEVEGGLIHHDVDLFASFAGAEEGGERLEVIAVNLPAGAGLGG